MIMSNLDLVNLNNTMRSILSLILFIISLQLYSQAQETEQQRTMAKQMAAYMDMSWDSEPEEGMANLRLKFIEGEEAFKGITSIHGRFNIKLQSRRTYLTSFNPNANGRYVYEGIEPGTYTLSISGIHEMEGFNYNQSGLIIKAGESPIVTISLPSSE